MYHSITFGSMNTWDDWHLVPSSRPVIAPPKPKTQYVDIPGADGSIDVTEALAGRPVFGDREGSIELIVLNQFNVEAHGIDNYDYNWVDVFSGIMQYLHGRFMHMVLEDDPNYYYEGRFEVESWTTGQYNSSITIGYHLAPYKYRLTTQIAKADLRVGAFNVDDTTDPPTVTTNNSVTTRARFKNAKQYTQGDSIKMTGSTYRFDIVLYDGSTVKAYVPSARMNGNRFEFTDSGKYNICIGRSYDPSGTALTDSDLEAMAKSLQYYTGGVL